MQKPVQIWLPLMVMMDGMVQLLEEGWIEWIYKYPHNELLTSSPVHTMDHLRDVLEVCT